MKSRKNQHFKQLLAATFAVSSSFGMVAPVLAQTAAGSDIKNSATATFSDGTTTYNATSNEVIIKVAEVAGVTVTAQTPSVTNPNSNDTLYVDFVITNTGNDPTEFFIPGTATLNSTTPGAFTINGPLKIVAVNGTNLPGNGVDVPNAGDTTGNLLPSNGSIPPNLGAANTGKITVRVPVKVTNAAVQGNSVTVSLGNTATPNTDNQDRSADIDGNDVNTQDNADGATGETDGVPSNGVREAMATSTAITVNARQQAFAAVLKAVSSYNRSGTPNVLTDDILTYGLALKVEANPTPLPGGLVTSDLYGTDINLDGAATPRVLVSDAIPTGMQLGQTSAIVAPTDWTPVYTTSPLSLTAEKAIWVTTRPAGVITRIGFVYNAATTPTATPIAKGTTVQGFSFAVTPQTSFSGGQVANIAQVFGQSQPGAPVPGAATQIVYDESGDQSSNNGLGGNNPDPLTTGGATVPNGGISNGVADPSADGTDPGTGTDPTAGNTNQGSTTDPDGGDDTVYNIALTPLNGPDNQPGATGPTDNNDDFTNKSIVVAPNTSPSAILTDAETPPITFNNTVQNTSGGSQVISLVPTPPTNSGDLIDGTKVTITDPTTNTSVIYTYTAAGGFTTTAPDPVRITVPAGANANYTVTVDLPAAPQLVGYPVPITAFVDVNGDDSPVGEPGNVTIDRVYTNYLKLEKKARMLEESGTPVAGTAGNFTTDQTALGAAATPGRIIEYQITYTNISTTGGSNSVILPANNLVITEDGDAGNNTWFAKTTDPTYPTAGGNGSAVGAGTINVTVTSGDIEIYTNTIETVAPQGNGTFTFRRKIK
ncbi:MAG: hypothetical protein KME29_10960 [Calothrix sp. FI2-JRJ7]|jgi:hypothetical protein|nr:hypothetical protein [Calothrix sp. FI2-JRJ7]